VRWLSGVALAGMLGGLPSRAAAQVLASVDANVASASYDGYLSSAVYTLAPAVAFAGGPVRVGLAGAFAEFETGHTSGAAELNAGVGTPIAGPLRWDLSGEGSALWYRSNAAVLSGLVMPRLRVARGPLDAWIGAGAGGTRNDGIPGSFVVRADAGVSYAWPYVTPTLTIATTHLPGIRQYTDVGGAMQSEIGRFDLSVTAGTRAGARIPGVATWSTWLNGEARVTVVNGVAIVLAGGSYPVDLVRGAPGVHSLSFGIRWSEAFRVRKPQPMLRYSALNSASGVMPDARTLRFSAQANAHVELMADFTDWQPVAMTEVRPGLFQVTLPEAIRSGPHRVNIRVDNGDWAVPNELPPVVDDFGGKAGALVVP
jgi:hypothetical protein